MFSASTRPRFHANGAKRLVFILVLAVAFAAILTAIPDDCLAAAKKATRRSRGGSGGSGGSGLTLLVIVAIGAAWYGAKIAVRVLVESCARMYHFYGTSAALIRQYFVNAANLNFNLLTTLAVVSIIYNYAYDDASSFILLGYLSSLFFLWLVINITDLRRDDIFSSKVDTADLLRYARTHTLRDQFREDLIEQRAKTLMRDHQNKIMSDSENRRS